MNRVSKNFVPASAPVLTGLPDTKNYFTWYVKIRAVDPNTKATKNNGTD